MIALCDLNLLPAFTVIGLTLGGLYALSGIGLVLIYRVSGVLNFAQGAVAMVSAFVAYEAAVVRGLPTWVGLGAGIAAGAALGYVMERFTIRPLAGRPAAVKVAVTIGWLLILQTVAGLVWGFTSFHRAVEVVSRSGTTFPGTSVVVGYDQMTIIGVSVVLAFGIAALLRWTPLGVSMRAVSDDPATARLWGITVNRVTAASWMLGSAMAGLAGVLITPMIDFNPFSLTVIVIDAFAAALIGRLVSLPWTVLGAALLGLVQTYPRACSSNAGMGEVATFGLILAALLVLRPGTRAVRAA
jgi:branched-subunit amino acid ABC-type transport system permease component